MAINWNQFRKSKYLKADGLVAASTVAQIVDVKVELVGRDDPEEKPVVYLRGRDGKIIAPLILNIVNTNTLREAFGDDEHCWTDRWIVLIRRKELIQGERRDVVRLQVPANAPKSENGVHDYDDVADTVVDHE